MSGAEIFEIAFAFAVNEDEQGFDSFITSLEMEEYIKFKAYLAEEIKMLEKEGVELKWPFKK